MSSTTLLRQSEPRNQIQADLFVRSAKSSDAALFPGCLISYKATAGTVTEGDEPANASRARSVDLRASEPDELYHAGAQIGPYEP